MRSFLKNQVLDKMELWIDFKCFFKMIFPNEFLRLRVTLSWIKFHIQILTFVLSFVWIDLPFKRIYVVIAFSGIL